MTNFEIGELDTKRIPDVSIDPMRVIHALAEMAPRCQIETRIGAVWERNGCPDYGSVSVKVSPNTSYRYHEDILISVVAVVDRDDWMPDKLKALVAQVEADAEAAKVARDQAELAAKRSKIAELRAQADRLEESLPK